MCARPAMPMSFDDAAVAPADAGSELAAAPVNRAERRAAARGRSDQGGSGLRARRKAGRAHTKAAHTRVDYAARRSG